MKTFNLNEKILITITEYGWEQAKKHIGEDYIKHCIIPYKTTIEGIDYYKMQAHQIITIWGKSVWWSYPCPIGINILIPE